MMPDFLAFLDKIVRWLRQPARQGLRLSIACRGERVAVIGPAGVGKTKVIDRLLGEEFTSQYTPHNDPEIRAFGSIEFTEIPVSMLTLEDLCCYNLVLLIINDQRELVGYGPLPQMPLIVVRIVTDPPREFSNPGQEFLRLPIDSDFTRVKEAADGLIIKTVSSIMCKHLDASPQTNVGISELKDMIHESLHISKSIATEHLDPLSAAEHGCGTGTRNGY